MKQIIGKFLFGSLFMFLLPLTLWVWANQTKEQIQLAVPDYPLVFFSVCVLGMFCMVIAMLQLYFQGKGLPMNAYPPKFKVVNGFYGILPHPIYTGACFMSFGISGYFQSPSGFWLVSPMLVLMCVAYVYGFEREQIQKVFGSTQNNFFFQLPADNTEIAAFKSRLSVAIQVFVPWIILYEAFIFLGIPADALVSDLAIESMLPFYAPAIVAYTFTYPFVALLPFVLSSNQLLRHFARTAQMATLMGISSYILFPFIVLQLPIETHGFFDKWVMWERSKDGVTCAFPAFHVIWAWVAAHAYSKQFKAYKNLFYVLAWLITLSCFLTRMHALADIIWAVAIANLSIHYRQSINGLLSFFEGIANSWREWRFGNIRIINHGFYAGWAGFVGTFILAVFLPPQLGYAGFLLGFSAIVGAALWAQIIEGSPTLLRPFGYYGSVAGVGICTLFLVFVTHADASLLFAAAALAAPWVQVIGRLRCLVQGCCHGKPAEGFPGICFHKENSRVHAISQLKGIRLHATQVYSLLANVFIGLFLFRLVSLQLTAYFICGIYLILNGLARFVEEAYRGELQTPYWKGMRIYQWVALGSVLLGMFMSSLPGSSGLTFQGDGTAFLWSMALGLFSVFAYGIDFPKSNWPFSRLSG